jgi:hypothetical protein
MTPRRSELKSENPIRIPTPNSPPRGADPEETLIADPRAGVRPAEAVERKLYDVLYGGGKREYRP